MPSVNKFFLFVSEEILSFVDLLNIVASAEKNSEHSLAKAVCRFAEKVLKKENFYKCTSFQVVPGCGLKTRVNYSKNKTINTSSSLNITRANFKEIEDSTSIWNCVNATTLANGKGVHFGKKIVENADDDLKSYEVLIGNREWMNRNFLNLNEKISKKMDEYESNGNTCVLCAIDGHIVAMIAIADQIKDEANLVVYTLKKMGLNVYLLTGDNRKTAGNIAKQVGIRKVHLLFIY